MDRDPAKNVHAVTKWRRNTKAKLVAEHGGKCVDCDYEGPPFMYDFDHRVPEDKEFGLGHKGVSRSIARQRAEAAKCDLVCASCHRWRTHVQRCAGCEDCKELAEG